MQPKKRVPITIDDDLVIDFSSLSQRKKDGAQSAKEAVASLLQPDEREPPDAATGATETKAFDARLQAYVQRRAAARRRRQPFGNANPTPSMGALPAPMKATEEGESEAHQEALLSLCEGGAQGSVGGPAEWRARRLAYTAALRAFCQGHPSLSTEEDKRDPAAAVGEKGDEPAAFGGSLLEALFAKGVPDIEPWDRWAFELPRYDPKALITATALPSARDGGQAGWSSPAAVAGVMDLEHHPILESSFYTHHCQQSRLCAAPTEAKLMKTKEELRKERRERLKRKQEQERQERLKNSTEKYVSGSAVHEDQLSRRSLAFSMFNHSIINPVATENQIYEQYQQRFLEHQRRNHERHVAALPNQILKRERDAVRHGQERPTLRAYRVYPIFSPAHLGKLRNLANDNRVRGVVVWVAKCDAVVVLAGGDVAMRHLERWILQKMKWEHSDTRATRLCAIPIPNYDAFSFCEKKARAKEEEKGKRIRFEARSLASASHMDYPAVPEEQEPKETVFMNFCETVAEGETFFRALPASGSAWKDLSAIWRLAFLRDGLS